MHIIIYIYICIYIYIFIYINIYFYTHWSLPSCKEYIGSHAPHQCHYRVVQTDRIAHLPGPFPQICLYNKALWLGKTCKIAPMGLCHPAHDLQGSQN